MTEPLSSEVCRHNQLQQPGGLGAPAQHPMISPIQTTARALPQVLHLKAFHIQLQLPYKYSLNENIPSKGALHRAAAELHHLGGLSSLQALPKRCPLTPHSSALLTGGPKLTVNIWLFIQPDEMPMCLADSRRAAWFAGVFSFSAGYDCGCWSDDYLPGRHRYSELAMTETLV